MVIPKSRLHDGRADEGGTVVSFIALEIEKMIEKLHILAIIWLSWCGPIAEAQSLSGARPAEDRLAERDRLVATAQESDAAGRLEESISLLLRVAKINEEEGLSYDLAGIASYLASLYERLGEYEKARTQLRMSRAILERLISEGSVVEASWRLVDVTWQQKDLELRRVLSEEDLARLEEARSLGREIGNNWRANQYLEAIPKARRALKLEKSVHDHGHPTVATRFHELGLLYHQIGDYYKAQDVWTQALYIRRKTLGQAHPLYGESLLNLGEISKIMARYEEAGAFLQEGYDTLMSVWPEGHSNLIRASIKIGQLEWIRGDLLAAKTTLETAWDQARDSEDDRLYREALAAYAMVEFSLGDWKRETALMDELEMITLEAVGKLHLEYARVLLNRAALEHEKANYSRSERYFEDVDQILRSIQAGPRLKASVYSNWALLRFETGDLVAAFQRMSMALEGLDTTLPQDHPQRAVMLTNLAEILKSMGDAEEAGRLMLEARDIVEARLAPGHPRHLAILNNLGLYYRETNNLQQAQDFLMKVVKLAPSGSREWAMASINLASVQLATGTFDAKARRDLESSMRSLAALTPPSHPTHCRALTILGSAQLAGAKPTEASATFHRSLDCFYESLSSAVIAQSERQQLAMLNKARQALDGFLSVSESMYLSTEKIYSMVLQWKGMVLARRLEVGRGANSAATDEILQELQTVSRRLSALAYTGLRSPKGKEELRRLRDRRDMLQRKLFSESDSYRRLKRYHEPRSQQVVDALPSDAVLIDFVEYESKTIAGVPFASPRPEGRSLVAFVLRRGQPIRRVELGSSEAIEVLVKDWHAALSVGDDRGVRLLGNLDEARAALVGVELHRRLWDPVASFVGDARLVLLAPDGPVASVPFGALPQEEGKGFLLEKKLFVWTPAAQIYAAERNMPSDSSAACPSTSTKPGLLAVGSVGYDVPERARRPPKVADLSLPEVFLGDHNFAHLPASGEEIRTIAEIFRETYPILSNISLEGQEATEENFRRSVSGQRFVHLATHGFFALPDSRPTLLRQGLGQNSSQEILLVLDQAGWEPALLSGIAFAGANQRQNSGDDDGILTALELENLNLCATEMLVLSACKTGLGVNAIGEGLLGLVRAAYVAGAQTVVASIWSVPDRETRDLMERFYRNLWQRNMHRAEALRSAQLEIMRAERNPAAWAGWVLTGEWR